MDLEIGHDLEVNKYGMNMNDDEISLGHSDIPVSTRNEYLDRRNVT
jgi:hypothetical protein